VLKACVDFKTVYGVPLGDFFKETPADGISMVFMEEKLFKTWHFGRTGLIGDGKSCFCMSLKKKKKKKYQNVYLTRFNCVFRELH